MIITALFLILAVCGGMSKDEAMNTGCYICGSTDELRPYGQAGAPICFPCMKASPEREAVAHANLGALLEANGAISPSGAVAIGSSSGPAPFDPNDIPPNAEVVELLPGETVTQALKRIGRAS